MPRARDLTRQAIRYGTLNILRPNYRYAYREYFDDYTHISVFPHISLADFLKAHGLAVIETWPRFLPLTVKSRLPVAPWLIRAYLASPIKPLAKQMLLRARVSRPYPEMKDHLSALHSHQQDPY